MICEYSYYPSNSEKPHCKNEKKLLEDNYFKEKCPLIYYCPISERFEQTVDMLGCKYREEDKNDRQ